MCYGPYDHKAMLRDTEARTASLRVPGFRFGPALSALARLFGQVRRARMFYPSYLGDRVE